MARPAIAWNLVRAVSDGLAGNHARDQNRAVRQIARIGGGASNSKTGLGSAHDLPHGTTFSPTILVSSDQMETIYAESWAAHKFIRLPVDDLWIRGRRWTDDNESVITAMEDGWRQLKIRENIVKAMVAARLHGTAFIVLVSAGGVDELATELDPMTAPRGSLRALHVFDRWDTEILSHDLDLTSTSYGRPYLYRFRPSMVLEGEHETNGDDITTRISFDVHHSRVVRFDGLMPPHSGGWRGQYERDWGVSPLIMALNEIIRDENNSGAGANLLQRASQMVVKLAGYRQMMAGSRGGPHGETAESIGEDISLKSSLYRLLMVDKADEVDRVSLPLSGVADVLNTYAVRLAAIAGIPATRFMGRSPVGLNATGESDMQNYATMVNAMQVRDLTQPLYRLDRVLAADLGHLKDGKPPEYEWIPLTDMSEVDRATVAKTYAEAASVAYDRGALDEDEFRERLSAVEFFGELPALPEDEKMDRRKLHGMLPEDDEEAEEDDFGDEE